MSGEGSLTGHVAEFIAGTTLVAAAPTRRRGYGIELKPEYAQVAIETLQNELEAHAELVDHLDCSDEEVVDPWSLLSLFGDVPGRVE